MTLAQSKKGQELIIEHIPDGTVRAQAIRFGIVEGTGVTCLEVLPRGPVIVKKGWQEIAVGRRLAASIRVREKEADQVQKSA